MKNTLYSVKKSKFEKKEKDTPNTKINKAGKQHKVAKIPVPIEKNSR
ncbi:hypothetical protein [Campylobacter pinnipediorum]|nr:hypothetical protein [Campylobacter pinnipediorum]